MSKICQITGKKAQIGNNVSHSKHRTKRSFDVNLFSKKFYYVEEGCWISLKISAAGLRLINKVGLDAALKQAVSKGYCDWSDIKVIGEYVNGIKESKGQQSTGNSRVHRDEEQRSAWNKPLRDYQES